MRALSASAAYTAERITLDYKSVFSVPGSDEAVESSECAVVLGQKQSQLNGAVIDNLKTVLEELFNAEDEANLDIAGFPTDSPDLPVEEMHTIVAEVFDSYKEEKHYKISDFLRIFFVQPWVASEAVEDIQLEELCLSKGLIEEKITTQIKGYQTTISQCEGHIEAFDKLVE